MKRILVIGCGGSGKSTLAQLLGEKLGIDVYHLDTLFWKPGWQESTNEEFVAKIEQFIHNPTWVMDGNYGGTMEWRIGFADTVIFLNFSTFACLKGAITRRFVYHGQSRPDMTEGNYERLEWNFIKWILTYRRNRRPFIMDMLNRVDPSKQVHVFQNREQVKRWLETEGLPD
jgi:adenylate kinase family enzyme